MMSSSVLDCGAQNQSRAAVLPLRTSDRLVEHVNRGRVELVAGAGQVVGEFTPEAERLNRFSLAEPLRHQLADKRRPPQRGEAVALRPPPRQLKPVATNTT